MNTDWTLDKVKEQLDSALRYAADLIGPDGETVRMKILEAQMWLRKLTERERS